MSIKPSILLINRIYPPERGATGRMLQNLAHGLERSGWNVTVLAIGERKDSRSASTGIKKRFIKGAKNPKTALGCFSNLCRLFWTGLRVPKCDVVLSMTDPQMLVVVGGLIAKFKKSRHVHWAQDIYPDLFAPLGVKLPRIICNFLHARSVRAMNKSDQVVVIGRCMEKYLKYHGVSGSKISVIQNWADFEVIAPSGKSLSSVPINVPVGVAKKPDEMFRDDSPKFRVLYAGNVGRAHTMRAVLEAAELLADRPEIEFVFVGDHHAHSMLARERTKRGLENIKFMPYQPIEKLQAVMEGGDVHLVTMRESVKGMIVPCKFYSGLSVGRPTIYVGPEGSEIESVINQYGAGSCVHPHDSKALADVIYGYRMDGDAWFQAQEGALRAAQDFHPNLSINKWIELLNDLRVR
jgi:glycosyltransferase involved in cell wall biosynthesis